MISDTLQLDLIFFFFFVNFGSAFVRSDWNVDFCHLLKYGDKTSG